MGQCMLSPGACNLVGEATLTILFLPPPSQYGPTPTQNLLLNPTALKKAKIVRNFGLSECNRVKE